MCANLPRWNPENFRLLIVEWPYEMEKQYIFCETGSGLGMLGVAILVVFAEAVVLVVWSPLDRWLDSVVLLASVTLTVWMSFKADRWALKRKKHREGHLL